MTEQEIARIIADHDRLEKKCVNLQTQLDRYYKAWGEQTKRADAAEAALKAPHCNADAGHHCDANDGEPCAACAEYLRESERIARRTWAVASPQEKDPERYERDMRDAGRLP